jgi:hypothetical protein
VHYESPRAERSEKALVVRVGSVGSLSREGGEAGPEAAPVSLTLRGCSLGRLPLWPPISDLAGI